MPGWVKYEREHKPAVAGILHKPAVAGILHKPAMADMHKPSRNGGRGAPHRQKKERMVAQEDVLKE